MSFSSWLSVLFSEGPVWWVNGLCRSPCRSSEHGLCRGGEAPLELLALPLEVERHLQPAAPLGERGGDLVERALHLGQREARVRIGRDAALGHGRSEGVELGELLALGEEGQLEARARAELAELLLRLRDRVRRHHLPQRVDALVRPHVQPLAPLGEVEAHLVHLLLPEQLLLESHLVLAARDLEAFDGGA